MKSMKRTIAALVAISLIVGCVIGGTLSWLTAKANPVTNVFTTSDITIELEEHTYDPSTDSLTTTVTSTGVDNYKMIPGWKIPKDPWVTVDSNSADCYLFVKVEETGGNVTVAGTSYDFDDFIAYNVRTNGTDYDNPWIVLDADKYPGVYYKVIDTSAEKTEEGHLILGKGTYTFNGIDYSWADNQVLTKPEVTKEMMNAVGNNKPTLKITAYASQLWETNKPGADATAEQITAAQFTAEEAWINAQPTS